MLSGVDKAQMVLYPQENLHESLGSDLMVALENIWRIQCSFFILLSTPYHQ